MVSSKSLLATLSALTLASAAKMGAVGIAVADMAASAKFYTAALGLQPTGLTIRTPSFDEIIMSLPGNGSGSALVLMQWKTPKVTKDLAVKLVFYVDDMGKAWKDIKTAGGKGVNEPGTLKLGNASIPTAFAKDLDGYLLELNPMGLYGKGVGNTVGKELPKGAGTVM